MCRPTDRLDNNEDDDDDGSRCVHGGLRGPTCYWHLPELIADRFGTVQFVDALRRTVITAAWP